MRLFRLEHTYCQAGNHDHGACIPFCQRARECIQNSFGFAGAPPERCDEPEYCAVTREQIPAWTGYDTTPLRARIERDNGWRFIEYEVPNHLARLDNNQYLIPLALATRVAEHDPVAILFPETEQLALFAA